MYLEKDMLYRSLIQIKNYEAGTVWIDDCTGNTCGYVIEKIKEDTQ